MHKGAWRATVRGVTEPDTTEQPTLALFTGHLPLQPPVTLPSPCSPGARTFGSQASGMGSLSLGT